MRPLTLILIAADRERAIGALSLAAAQAACGAAVRLHLDLAAIPLLADPDLRRLVDEATALGATLSLCPTGLADAGIEPPPLPDAERIGLVTLLAELDDAARLIVV